MPVFDPASIAGILADLVVSLLSYAGVAAILYALGEILIRTISWSLDKMIISLIAKFYDYYEQILGGTLFTESIVDGMMNRVYLLIGVFFVFRLGMLLIQYIINPAEVMEEKGGVNSLVKRAITGLVLIIFIPTIFDIANDLQTAMIKDQIIERVIMDKEAFQKVEEQKKKYGTGRIIGMTVFQGFWNVDKNQVKDKNIIRAYDEATEKKDAEIVDDAGYGILTKSGGKYAFSYFPILSTFVLGYVLYLVIKYCIDMVLRLFKLLILQIIAPITIVEYIINGDRNEIFKKWRTSVIANYLMLFIRVFTIWFTSYVTYLMDPAIIGTESLLATDDYLLKAIIILALLAFMMDFPKMMSDILGLDLEQDSAVKGVMGKAMGVATAGLAIGGAAATFGFKAAGGISGAMKGGLHNTQKGAGLKANLSNFSEGFKSTAKENKLGQQLGAGAMGLGAAVMQSNSVTGSMYKGYSGVNQSIKDKKQKEDSKEKADKERQEDLQYREQQKQTLDQINATTTASYGQQIVTNNKLSDIEENTERTVTETINVDQKLGAISGDIKSVAQNTETTAQQIVNVDQKLGQVSSSVGSIKANTDMIAEDTIQQTINVDQKLGQISSDIGSIKANTDMIAEDTIEQTINVDQKLGQISSDIGSIKSNTDMIAEDTIEQTIDVDQKLGQISSDVKSIKTNTDMIAEDTIEQTIHFDQTLDANTTEIKPKKEINSGKLLDE